MPRPKSLSELLLEDDMSAIPNNVGDVNLLDTFNAVAGGISKASGAVIAGANAYSDYQDAKASVNKATSHSARTSSEAGLSVDDRTTKVKRISQTTPVGHSNLFQRQSGIGSSSTQVVGNNTAAPIQLKLGKQLMSNDSVANFLSLMSGSASVSQAFGGRLVAAQDTRVRTYQCYRHNLHGEEFLSNNGPYPTGANIMLPGGPLGVQLEGGYNGTPSIPHAPIQDIADGSAYFSFYNKADLEDISWNLNKFKLGPQISDTSDTVNGPSPKVQILDDTPVAQQNAHRAYSRLRQNNVSPVSRPSLSSGSLVYQSAPYMYDAVFKQGTIDYMFMNKGESPCEVEIVVYRVKQNSVQGVPTKFDDFSIADQLESPITQGMLRKTIGAISTDMPNVFSQSPHAIDWVTDPRVPFLPKNRFTISSRTPYSEVNRVKLCMQSGQRRPFQLKLGGVQYDPSKRTSVKGTGTFDDDAQLIPMFDQDSYVVCIALNGIAMSRQLGGETAVNAEEIKLTTGPIVGDCYAPADLQWYSQYTEDVGAMSYKKSRTRSLFNYGSSAPLGSLLGLYNQGAGPGQKISSTPVAMLTQAQTVRIPQTPTQIRYGTGGASGTGYATSTSNSAAASGGATTTPA